MSSLDSLSGYIARMKQPDTLVCGVAAMMADKFDWSCLWTRVVWALAVIMNPSLGLLVYFVLALVLPKWQKSGY
ncbi:PspC domain-containing protein [Shewanella nanhaiensis]|uniref:PspC domain-containing protein n=1 Tax=Shewanella nanhaiensis TaxID=2864872 RepID=A0ABS7E0W6_9GAMM|nr:PspC domain-containing protein [Shewanella nanhaiensis]MBW8182652.1 PspC domain-containing protein [Shewanella nanhaiensis]